MKIGKPTVPEKLLFVERDLTEGQQFVGQFSGLNMRRDKNGREREYVVIVGNIGGCSGEYLAFPNILVGANGLEIDPTTETRTFYFKRQGRNLLFSL